MWRSDPGRLGLAALVSALACLAACGAEGRPRLCAPPAFEEGRRLHPRGEMTPIPVSLALRQHAVCWHRPGPDAQRVFVFGNSGAYGHPLPAEASFDAELERRFTAQGWPVHFYNLAHVYTYQLKDVLILRESLRYGPDLLVYAVTLDDLKHVVPAPYEPLPAFFEANATAVARLAAERPAGLAEPFERYRTALGPLPSGEGLRAWRNLGRLVRRAIRAHATRLRHRWFDPSLPPGATVPPEVQETIQRKTGYSCRETKRTFHRLFQGGWWEWNVLAYLEQVRRRTGVDVVVLDWPVAHEPRGACYNVRMPGRAFARYRAWLQDETRRRSLPLVDLHDLLGPEAFFDSVHLRPEAQRRVADALEPVLRARLARRTKAEHSAGSREPSPDP